MRLDMESVTLNNSKLLKDIRMNIEKNRGRVKMIISGENDVDYPLDIIVSNMSFKPGLTTTVHILGKELNYNVDINIDIRISVIKENIIINGRIDGKEFNKDNLTKDLLIDTIKTLKKNIKEV